MKVFKKVINKTIYKQYDSRWGDLAYPVFPTTLAKAGCGCCAVTHLANDQNKYDSYTPQTVRPFMKQYAVVGHGTEWKGIDEGMKHFGMKNVKRFDDMSAFFAELRKGNRGGVLLLGTNKAPDGRIFTTVGHYIAFTGYKESNNGKKHYLYLKDSGGRNNQGWLCYETSIEGCLKKMWVGELTSQLILPIRGYIQKGDSGESVKIMQQFLKDEKCYNGKIGGNCKTFTVRGIKKLQKKYSLKEDGLFGPECLKLYEVRKGNK